jgi:hypothetical protein
MAWTCVSCGVRNSTDVRICRWCGAFRKQEQPTAPVPVPYPPPSPSPSAPNYGPQQGWNPPPNQQTSAYPERQSFVNDLRAMGGRGAAGLTFGASMGTAAGWTLGRMLARLAGCLIILLVIAVIIFVICLFTKVFAPGSVTERPTQQNTNLRFDDEFISSCVASAKRTGVPAGIAGQYCDCALRIFKQTGSQENAKEVCTAEVLRNSSREPETRPPADPARLEREIRNRLQDQCVANLLGVSDSDEQKLVATAQQYYRIANARGRDAAIVETGMDAATYVRVTYAAAHCMATVQ